MTTSEDIRQEASISNQTRIDIRRLATLTNYFERNGHRIRNISQLIADSVEMLCNILSANGTLEVEYSSIIEAQDFLASLGLRQASMDKKNFKKLGAAIRFESMRGNGVDPKMYVPQHYNVLHNKNSVQPGNMSVEVGGVSQYEDDWQKMKLMKQREAFEENQRVKAQGGEIFKEMGTLAPPEAKIPTLREGMSDDELAERNRIREVDILRRENAPLDMEFLRSQVVKEPEKK